MSKQAPKKFDHEISIDRVACPLHVLQLKKGFNLIKKDETLKINTNAYVAPEILAAARQIGTEVTINDDNEIFVKK